MINIHDAIYALNSSVITIHDDIAYDADGNKVAYDKKAVEAMVIQMQAEAEAAKQAAEAAKQSALNKLAAIGLTPDEIKSLLGV
jgi:hypothetical protein